MILNAFFKLFRKRKKKYEINEFDVFNEINVYIFISTKMFKNYRFKFEKAYKKNKKWFKIYEFLL